MLIDIHCHVLFGVDDGAKTLEDAVEMLKKATESGVTKLIVTPHYMEDGYKSSPKEIMDKISSLKQKIKEEKINIEIYPGEEVFIFLNIYEKLNGKEILSLNNTKYVLIEFPLYEEINYIDDIIFKLTSMEKIPIIAHPERYLTSVKNFDKIKKLIANGALLQINANSLVGHYGKKQQEIAIKLLKNNMAHFVASDAHSAEGFVLLEKSLRKLKEIVGEKKYNEITIENEEKLLNNETIIPEILSKVQNKENFWQLLKKLIIVAK